MAETPREAAILAAQGYIPAGRRDACCNCLDGQEQTEGLAPRWCSEGAFRVTAMGWCPKHTPRGYQDGPRVGQPA